MFRTEYCWAWRNLWNPGITCPESSSRDGHGILTPGTDKYAGQYYFFAGEKLHGITHAQALLDLSLLGYPELAKKGLPGLNKQLELVEKRPDGLAVAELNHAFGDEAIPLEKLHRHFAFLN